MRSTVGKQQPAFPRAICVIMSVFFFSLGELQVLTKLVMWNINTYINVYQSFGSYKTV